MITTDILLKVADRLGVPTAFAAILCAAIYWAGSWTAKEVVKPVVTSHTEFMKAETEKMELISTAVTKQTRLLEDIRNDQRKFPAVAEGRP